MKALILVASLLSLLTGCDGQNGAEPGAPVPAGNCLELDRALRVQSFSSASAAVSAFATASQDCGSSASAVKAEAERLEKDGINIQGASQ
jgi:hypothetical protein